MKKYLLILLTVILLTLSAGMLKDKVFAMPSFELYSNCDPDVSNCDFKNTTPYPTVSHPVVKRYLNYITITAYATDVSGILSLVAVIEDPKHPGQYMNNEYSINGTMHDDGSFPEPYSTANDGWYGIKIDTSNQSIWDSGADYVVDISSTDNLLKNSISMGGEYLDVGGFKIEGFSNCVGNAAGNDATHNNAYLCITTTPMSNMDQMTSFTVSPTTADANGVQVTLSANIGLANQTINFRDDTASVNIGNALTNSSGVATIHYTTFLGMDLGSHTLKAIYNGGSGTPAQRTNTLNITSTQNCKLKNSALFCIITSFQRPTGSTDISLITPSAAKKGDVVSLSATLLKDGVPVSGETISFTDTTDSVNIGTQITNVSGVAQYSYTIPSGATSGNHVIQASYAGNTIRQLLASDTTSTLNIDGTPPVVIFTVPTFFSSLTVPVSFSASDVGGTGVVGYLITESSMAPTAGWLATAQTSYVFTTDGTKTLYAWAKDAAGNVSTSVSHSVVVDITAPTVTDNVPASWQKTNTTVTLTCSDVGSGCLKVYYTTDGTIPDTNSTYVSASSSWQFVSSTEGSFTIKYKGQDNAGNLGNTNTASYLLRLDKTGPNTSDNYTLNDNVWQTATPQIITLAPGDNASGAASTKYCTLTTNICIPSITINSPYQITISTAGTTHVCYASTDNAGNAQTAVCRTVKIDTTAPSGGSITPPTGYATTSPISITFSTGTDSVSGLFNNSGTLQRASATFSNNTCGTFGGFADSLPGQFTSPVTDSVSSGNCYMYQYHISDNAGNVVTYSSANVVKVDTIKPTTSDDYGSKNNNWQTASQTITLTPNDTASGIATNGTKYCTDTANTCAPSLIAILPYQTTISTIGTSYFRYFSTDNAGNVQTTVSRKIMIDSNAPAGSITYANGFNTTGSVSITYTAADVVSGVNNASGRLQRASTNMTNGVCGTFGGFSDLVTGYTGSYTDTAVSTGNCYMYQYIIADNAGNSVTYTSANVVKVDTVPPTTTDDYVAKDGNWQAVSQTITMAPYDVSSGTNSNSTKYCTDTINTCAPGTIVGNPYQVTVSTAGTTYLRYASTDNAGNVQTTVSRKVMIDTTAPSGGSVTYANGYVTTASVPVTYSIGTDTVSGFNNSSGKIQRKIGGLMLGSCMSLGAFSDLHSGYNDSPYSDTTVVNGSCYMYQYIISDNSGNAATYISANIVKVDTKVETIDAGPDENKTSQFTQTATAADGYSGINASTYLWSKISGPGTITFSTPTALSTTITASTSGTYVIQFYVKDNAGNVGTDTFTLVKP